MTEERTDEEPRLLDEDLFQGADPRVFSTSPEEPEEGRTFVWANTLWFERLEGESGAAEFSPLSMAEADLHEWLREQGLEMTELDDEFTATVREEFLNQAPLYPEAPELSNQPS